MNLKYKILFVCLGNICRSPMAEAVADKLIKSQGLEHLEVDSAGIMGYHEGDKADPRMRKHGGERGYAVTSISRPVTYQDFEDFDLIVGMDDSNIRALYDKAPSVEASRKIVRMADYLTSHPDYDHIPDPYYGGAKGFDLVIDLLEDGVTNLLKQLPKK
ncbi:low molecular weight protein-tyrosine-phosphatase [Porphyromonas cangingivalis]|uniref:Protein-tyrosine phosphatase n=1 Tax=Porphyromonas cangingivalis TaxID=36874 RepID=A0A1T4MRZ5_PORCN|nr:low molecular weight protein-tyrosine-phosphatase [Porphyromonas cangingivalis]KGL47869.1 phosphotyrosine protein phosphatase [Porphyromonas cangingivalis]SJZ69545.1 protein-tyrosine phosphatase [Porphyromonas cangingivalis]VEJ04844.1 Low molecular weight protein-tyrosine-phosphatase yfkJ [Porphyromonas cangingivalis]